MQAFSDALNVERAVDFGGSTLSIFWSACMTSCSIHKAEHNRKDQKNSFFKVRNWRWNRLGLSHSGETQSDGKRSAKGDSVVPIHLSINNDVLRYVEHLKTLYIDSRDQYRFEKCLKRFRALYSAPASHHMTSNLPQQPYWRVRAILHRDKVLKKLIEYHSGDMHVDRVELSQISFKVRRPTV